MRSTSCALCLLLMPVMLASEAAAQAPVSQAWAVRIDELTNTPIKMSRMAVGPSGDVFLTGLIPGPAYYLNDILITRRSSSGALVWERRYEPPEGVSANEWPVGIVAHGTNVYVAGIIMNTNGGGRDFLTLKYRDNGDLVWAARSDGPYADSGTAISVDGQGNVVVVGQAVGTNGNIDVVVLKYGPTGNLLWTYSYDHPQHGADRAVGMRMDAVGNIHVAGTSAGVHDKGRSVITFKLDPDGQVLWMAEETWGGLYGATARSMDIDSAGNVVTLGSPPPYSVTWKYDANGNRQWTALYRAEEAASMSAYDVRVNGNGEIIVAARLSSNQTNDTVLIKYAADGQQIWATRISRPNWSATLTALDLDSAGNSYLAMAPGSDVITVKVSPTGAQLWSVTNNHQGSFSDDAEFLQVTPGGDIFVAVLSIYYSETFVSLVKYTQQPVTGFATAVVTPALQVVYPGTNVVFRAQTTGPGPIQFQWRKNGRPIAGNNSTLALSNVQGADHGDYSVIIYNPAGATISPEARLSVRVPPQVVIAPTQTLAYAGMETAFAATVTDPANNFLTLQWRHNGTNLPGATNGLLRLTNLNAGMSGSYDIVASTIGGTTTSSAAGLTISRAVEQLETTPYQSAIWNWPYAPLLRVLPNGESVLAGGSNHLTGDSIVLEKRAANGERLWATGFESRPGFEDALPSHLFLDGAGNIYIAGYARCCDSGPGGLAVLKYNPDGQLLWSRFVTNPNFRHPWDFVVDAQGNSVIGSAGAIFRYNHAGDLQWSFYHPSSPEALPAEDFALAVNDSGDTYLGTSVNWGGWSVRVELRKFDSAGALLWTVPYAQLYRRYEIRALAVDATGHLIAAGLGSPEGNTPPHERQMFVQKYSPGGQNLWERRFWDNVYGGSYGWNIIRIAVGPGNEITLLNTYSESGSYWGGHPELTRLGPDGQVRYRTTDTDLTVFIPQPLALDNFGNAYVTGSGLGAVTAKYDAAGRRRWLVKYDPAPWQPHHGIAVGVDAAGDIRVLVKHDFDYLSELTLVHYRQRDATNTFRLQLIADPGGTFHLTVPTQEPFQIEASTDLRTWDLLSEAETHQLLQPGAISFADAPKRFFRVVFTE